MTTARELSQALILLCAASWLASCSNSGTVRGVPKNLPTIDLHGSAATPRHSMDRKDYPFDANGDYQTSWAALGGGAAASDSDIESWRSSHGGSVSRKQPSPVKKVSSKKVASSGKSKAKSGSSSKSKPKTIASSKSKGGASKSGGSASGGYTIKSGDSLSTIAARNGTTVAKLKAANSLTSDAIRAGKTLKIPR